VIQFNIQSALCVSGIWPLTSKERTSKVNVKAFPLNIILWKPSRRERKSRNLRIKNAQSGKASDLYLGNLWLESCPVDAIGDGIPFYVHHRTLTASRGQLKCDGARAESRFRVSKKQTSPFKSAGASVQSTTGSRGVRISGSNAGYTMFRGSVQGTGYPLHSPVSPSLPLPCVTVCHHISTGV
jgi:hypothetical protein